MRLPYLLLFLSLMIFSGCSNVPKAVFLNPVDSLNQEMDEDYQLGGISGICMDNNNIYCIDDTERNIMVFKRTTLEYTESLGREGKGPGELMFPTHIEQKEDSLIVLDKINRKLVKFNKVTKEYRETSIEQIYSCILKNNNVIYALGDLRFPEVQIFDVTAGKNRIEMFKDVLSQMNTKKDRRAVPLVNATKLGKEYYIVYAKPVGLQRLNGETALRILIDFPDSFNQETIQFRTIHSYNGNLLILGFYHNMERSKTTNFALLCDRVGKIIKNYTLVMPENEAILTSAVDGTELFVATHEAKLYKYSLK